MLQRECVSRLSILSVETLMNRAVMGLLGMLTRCECVSVCMNSTALPKSLQIFHEKHI